MFKTIALSLCLAVSSFSLDARAQGEPQYADGPVTEVDEVHVEYGHFEEYVDWLNSTWKPTMEALKKNPMKMPEHPAYPDYQKK